jgi:tetratricopeptide (TPR) repeat protein
MEELNVQLRGLSPSTSEDYLFRGFARERSEPGHGLSDIDEGLKRANSPLGLALRALAQINRAMDTGKVEDAEQAMADADAARGIVAKNQMVLFASAYSRIVAGGLYREAKRHEDSDRLLKQVALDVAALAPFVRQANPMWVTWQYYDDIGDSDNAVKVARDVLVRSPGPIPAAYCAVSLYRNREFTEALKCLDQLPQPDLWCDGIRCFVLAELPGDGPKQALAAYIELENKYPKAVVTELQLNDVLLLLGKKQLAQASVKPYTGFSESREWRDYYEAMYDFRRGRISEKALLDKTTTSRWQQCRAHTVVGLTRLADGDRKGAREHFAKGLETRVIWAFAWNQCEMFLARIDQDDEWPRWIQK